MAQVQQPQQQQPQQPQPQQPQQPPQQQQAQQQAAQAIVQSTSPANQFVSTSLYVGDLEQGVSEAQLYEFFSQVGQVLSIRVCRDLVTRRSLGYAYVNYNNVTDAQRALELLNFTPVNGKSIRIMYSHRDPSIRKSGSGNIFIKHLDKSIDNKALYDTFSVFGNILSCKVATDATGQSKGYGFVQFEQEESAQSAIQKVDGMQLGNGEKKVVVAPFIRRQERDQQPATKFNNVYVKNLSESITEEELQKYFGAYGPITSAVVMKKPDGSSRLFGFVNFQNSEDAAKAVEGLNGRVIDDKDWYVGRAQKKSEREAELRAKFEQERKDRDDKYQGANLYLKNLDDDVDDEKLKELFADFGTITSCKVMRDPQGQSKGSGFVAFSSPEEANRAAVEMNGKMIGSKPIYVAMAQRKEERRAKLQAQFAQMRSPVAVGAGVATSMPMYHPGAPGLGQQIFYGQPPALMPPQPAGFGYQQQMLGMRPGGQLPSYFVPAVVQRQGPQGGQRAGGARRGAGTPVTHQQQLAPPQQQPMMRGGNRNFRYSPAVRNTPEVPVPPQGLMNPMLPVPIDMGSVPVAPVGGPQLPISALASALASAPLDQQRVMLGEQLYPLVDVLEHDHAGKVTGMLLEMDQTEILHLLESPEALKAKVAEAMDVLRMAQRTEQQLGSLSLNEPIST